MSYRTENRIPFEELPNIVADLCDEVRELKSYMRESFGKDIKNRWLSVDDLQEYLPEHPSKSTIYAWAEKKKIPAHKNGKFYRFNQDEIDAWLMDGKRYKYRL